MYSQPLLFPHLVEFCLYWHEWNVEWATFFLLLSILPAWLKWSESQRFSFFLLVASSLLIQLRAYDELLLSPFRIAFASFFHFATCMLSSLYTTCSYLDILETLHTPLLKDLFDIEPPTHDSIQSAIRAFDVRISQYVFGPPEPVEDILQFVREKGGRQTANSIQLQKAQLTQLLELFVYLLKKPLYKEDVQKSLEDYKTKYLDTGLVVHYMQMAVWDSYVNRMHWTPILETVLKRLDADVECMTELYGNYVKEGYEVWKPVVLRYLASEEQKQLSLAKVQALQRLLP